MRFDSTPLLLLCWTACAPMDVSLVRLEDEPFELPELEMSMDLAFQRSQWGEQIGRCQVQVAFYETSESDQMGSGATGEVIDMPIDTPDGEVSCALTRFDGDQAQGFWGVRGTLEAAESVTLLGKTHSVELLLERDANDRLVYALPGCDAESFPFGQVYDLLVEGPPVESQLGRLPSFALPNAVVVGPQVDWAGPAPDDQDVLIQSRQAPLELAWTFGGEHPTVDEEPVARQATIFLRNQHRGVGQPFEALACQTSADHLEIPAEILAQLTPSGEDGDPYVALQVDVRHEGPEASLPWSQVMRNRSLVTIGGTVYLVD